MDAAAQRDRQNLTEVIVDSLAAARQFDVVDHVARVDRGARRHATDRAGRIEPVEVAVRLLGLDQAIASGHQPVEVGNSRDRR